MSPTPPATAAQVVRGGDRDARCRGRRRRRGEPLPARRASTPKPRIFGAQTAFVTAEPMAAAPGQPRRPELYRLRPRRVFHWDTETRRGAARSRSSMLGPREPAVRARGQGGVFGTRASAARSSSSSRRAIPIARSSPAASTTARTGRARTAPTHSTLCRPPRRRRRAGNEIRSRTPPAAADRATERRQGHDGERRQ